MAHPLQVTRIALSSLCSFDEQRWKISLLLDLFCWSPIWQLCEFTLWGTGFLICSLKISQPHQKLSQVIAICSKQQHNVETVALWLLGTSAFSLSSVEFPAKLLFALSAILISEVRFLSLSTSNNMFLCEALAGITILKISALSSLSRDTETWDIT